MASISCGYSFANDKLLASKSSSADERPRQLDQRELTDDAFMRSKSAPIWVDVSCDTWYVQLDADIQGKDKFLDGKSYEKVVTFMVEDRHDFNYISLVWENGLTTWYDKKRILRILNNNS